MFILLPTGCNVYLILHITLTTNHCFGILQTYAAILFIGVFCGSLFFGYLSDRYGRKLALLAAILTVTISPTIGAYMPTAAGFGFFRFIMGKMISFFDKTSVIKIIEEKF